MRACWTGTRPAAGCRWRCRSSTPTSSTAAGRTLPTRSISAPTNSSTSTDDDNAYVNDVRLRAAGLPRAERRRALRRCGTNASSRWCWAAATAGSCRARTGAPGTRCSARAAATACRVPLVGRRDGQDRPRGAGALEALRSAAGAGEELADAGAEAARQAAHLGRRGGRLFPQQRGAPAGRFSAKAKPAYEGKITYGIGKGIIGGGAERRSR